MSKETESRKKSFALSLDFYDKLKQESENTFYQNYFSRSVFDSHNLSLKANGNEYQFYNFDLWYLMQEQNLPVRFGGEKLTISGGSFFADYMDGYKAGQHFFKENYTLSNDAVYSDAGKELAKRLAGKFVVNGKTKTQGWNYIFTSKPLSLSAKMFFEYGYYAGIVYELQTLLRTHETILEHFKARVKEFYSPCFEIRATRGNSGLSLELRKHESELRRINGDYENDYEGELEAQVYGFAAWLFEVRNNEKQLFDLKEAIGLIRKIKTFNKAELYQRYFDEKLNKANGQRLSGSHLNQKEFAAILKADETKHLSNFIDFEKHISDFAELHTLCLEFIDWLAEVAQEPRSGIGEPKPAIVKEYALTYILDLYASGKQIPINPIEGGYDAKEIMKATNEFKDYNKTPDAFYRAVKSIKKDFNLNSKKDLDSISKRWFVIVKKLSNNWQETKAYLQQNELYME